MTQSACGTFKGETVGWEKKINHLFLEAFSWNRFLLPLISFIHFYGIDSSPEWMSFFILFPDRWRQHRSFHRTTEHGWPHRKASESAAPKPMCGARDSFWRDGIWWDGPYFFSLKKHQFCHHTDQKVWCTKTRTTSKRSMFFMFFSYLAVKEVMSWQWIFHLSPSPRFCFIFISHPCMILWRFGFQQKNLNIQLTK